MRAQGAVFRGVHVKPEHLNRINFVFRTTARIQAHVLFKYPANMLLDCQTTAAVHVVDPEGAACVAQVVRASATVLLRAARMRLDLLPVDGFFIVPGAHTHKVHQSGSLCHNK